MSATRDRMKYFINTDTCLLHLMWMDWNTGDWFVAIALSLKEAEKSTGKSVSQSTTLYPSVQSQSGSASAQQSKGREPRKVWKDVSLLYICTLQWKAVCCALFIDCVFIVCCALWSTFIVL